MRSRRFSVAVFALILLLGLIFQAPICLGTTIIGGTVVTLDAIADSYADSTHPDTNYGGEEDLYVGSNSEFNYTYVMFNLLSIPSGANIISARLGLYLSDTGGEIYGWPADAIGVYYSSDSSWTESQITWNNKPSFDPTPTDTWSFGIIYYLREYEWWDVTKDVRAAFASGKLTEALRFEEKTDYGYAAFCSREGAHKPQLVVKYTLEPIYEVHLESAQDTGASLNLGLITIANETFSLPAVASVVRGSYQISYASGYSFLRWETSGGVSVSDAYAKTTTVTVSGTGNLRVIGSGETIEYGYDDGTVEYSASKKTKEMVAVRFTPVLSDKLVTARLYFWYVSDDASKNTVKVHILDANREDLITPLTQAPTSRGWFDVDLSAYGLTVTAGNDFYIAVEWAADYSPNLGGDSNKPDGRSWNWEEWRAEWEVEENWDYMIRAVVGKMASTVACSSTPGSVIIGSSITVSGSISPAHGGVEVTLTYIRPDGSIITRSVTTTATGSYSDVYTPDRPGSWAVYASWAGDEDHAGEASPRTSFTVTKASSQISCSASPGKVEPGGAMTISGSISPPHAGANVTLIFTKPDGSNFTRTAMSTSDGSFTYTLKPEEEGTWNVGVSWPGDEDHEGAASSTSFVVEKRPIPTTIFVGAGLVIVIVVVIAVILLKRR